MAAQREPSTAPTEALRAAVSAALREWDMLDGVNRLGVGVSGGADSIALLDTLAALGLRVELVPIHVHQHPAHQRPGLLASHIESTLGFKTHVVAADTSAAARRALAAGKAPCRLCAPVRAERLGAAARDLRLDALALGHHLDDAAATLLMNIFHRGKTETMRPVARRRNYADIPVLRPMLLVPERTVKAAAPVAAEGLFDCGMCSLHSVERARATRFVAEMFGEHEPAAEYLADLVRALAVPGRRRAASRGRAARR